MLICPFPSELAVLILVGKQIKTTHYMDILTCYIFTLLRYQERNESSYIRGFTKFPHGNLSGNPLHHF